MFLLETVTMTQTHSQNWEEAEQTQQSFNQSRIHTLVFPVEINEAIVTLSTITGSSTVCLTFRSRLKDSGPQIIIQHVTVEAAAVGWRLGRECRIIMGSCVVIRYECERLFITVSLHSCCSYVISKVIYR